MIMGGRENNTKMQSKLLSHCSSWFAKQKNVRCFYRLAWSYLMGAQGLMGLRLIFGSVDAKWRSTMDPWQQKIPRKFTELHRSNKTPASLKEKSASFFPHNHLGMVDMFLAKRSFFYPWCLVDVGSATSQFTVLQICGTTTSTRKASHWKGYTKTSVNEESGISRNFSSGASSDSCSQLCSQIFRIFLKRKSEPAWIFVGLSLLLQSTLRAFYHH